MTNKTKTRAWLSVCMLTAFILWTVAVCLIDVQAIGPNGATVGLATMNGLVHRLTGVNLTLYTITDWLGLIPLAVAVGFGVLGLVQWIRRRHIGNVDVSLYVLGGLYIVTMAVYLLFETVVINVRPVLINGVAEASYPSSTTVLVLCVMPTAMHQLRCRIRCRWWRRTVMILTAAFTVFMVIGRLMSGVHWCSDIIGGVLISAALVGMYGAVLAGTDGH